MKIKNNKIIITGGHLTPALAVMDELLDKKFSKKDVVWVGHQYSMIGDTKNSAEYEEVNSRGITFINLSGGKLYRTFSIKSLISLFRIPYGFLQACIIILSNKPAFVISFGGYLAVPIAFWAYVFNVPIYTHEQTLVLGRANKFIQKLARKVFLSWSQNMDDLSEKQRNSEKFILTGNPIRNEVFEKRTNKFDFNNKKKTIYITGGNQGSHRINQVVMKSIETLLEKYNVIHQCGSTSLHNDIEELTKMRNALPERFKASYIVQQGFWEEEIGAVFNNADLIISRAGANSITEIIALKKPCILIPIPWTAGNEQVKNAELVEQIGLGIILDQELLTKKMLLSYIEEAFKIDVDSLDIKTQSNSPSSLIVNEILKDFPGPC